MEPTTVTNFFTLLSKLLVAGLNLTMTFKMEAGKMTVGVRPQRSDIKDDSIESKIQPLVLTHTCDDLDNNFFETITAPMAKVDELADFLANIEKIKADAQAEKSKPAQKASTSTSSKSKAKKPIQKAAPAKVQAPAVDKEKEKADKEKAAQEKKIAGLIEEADAYISAAQTCYKAGRNGKGDDEISKAKAKLSQLPVEHVEGVKLYVMITEVEAERDALILAAKTKEADTIMEQAVQRIKVLDYPAGAKLLAKVLDLVPDHAEATKTKADMIEKFGEATVTQLLKQ